MNIKININININIKYIKYKIKDILNFLINDFLLNNTRAKADISELQRKLKLIKKQRRHTKEIYFNNVLCKMYIMADIK